MIHPQQSEKPNLQVQGDQPVIDLSIRTKNKQKAPLRKIMESRISTIYHEQYPIQNKNYQMCKDTGEHDP